VTKALQPRHGGSGLSRDTVLDAVGIKPPGSVRRRVAWSEVLAVEQSKMAFCYRSIEVSVRGRRRPVMLPERRDGRDFIAVQSRR
jgi:hypothetical protein